MEPDWEQIQERMMRLTLRQLKPVRWWFSGYLGAARTRHDVIALMVREMRRWWHMPDGIGRQRVRNVLRDLKEVEEGICQTSLPM